MEDQFKIWNAEFTEPMTRKYYYRVGDKNQEDKKSNIFEVTITRCGLETVSVLSEHEASKTYDLG